MKNRSKRGATYIVIGSLLISTFLIFNMFTSETNNSFVNLALKKEDKVYVFSKQGTHLVQNSIAKNESPSSIPFVQLFEEDGILYMTPDNLEKIADVLSGNYQTHEYQEKSFNGYITSGKSVSFERSYKNESTANIGEQLRLNTVQLNKLTSKDILRIRWKLNMKSYKLQAVENCKKKSFMIATRIQPGEVVRASEDFIMVNLKDLVKFYGDKVILELNVEDQLLYFIQE